MRWFDPIDQRWIETREPVADPVLASAPEDDYARGERLVMEARTWEAVVASATASCISGSHEENEHEHHRTG